MTIYDETFGQFRPRPPLWRLAAVSVCQFVLAAMLANALASAYEAWVIWRSDVRPVVVEVTPWSTAFTRLRVRSGVEYGEKTKDPAFSFGRPVAPEDEGRSRVVTHVQGEHMQWNGYPVAALMAMSWLLVMLWPSSPRFGSRLFVHTFAEMLVVAAWCLAPHEVLYSSGLWYHMPTAAKVAGLLTMVMPFQLIWIERRAIAVLANVYTIDRRRRLLVIWLARAVVPALVLGGLAYAAAPRNSFLAWGYVMLLVATFIAAIRRPPERFEQLTDPELRRGFGVLVIAALAIGIASFAVFGIKKTRAVTITAREAKLQRWDELDFAQRPRDRQPRGADGGE
jgi:hypothetical protein